MPRLSFCQRCILITVIIFSLYILIRWVLSDPADYSDSIQQEGLRYNDTFAKKVLLNLCDSYREGSVTGGLCAPLCYKSINTFLDVHVENKVVFVVTVNGQKLVLKSQRTYFGEFDTLPEYLSDNDFKEKVRSAVNHNLQLGWPHSRNKYLIDILWPMSQKVDNLTTADRKSLWSLVSQEEYLTFTILNLARVFPKVLGTCGHFYAVEYLVPFRLKSYYTNLKAKILVHVMGTLKLFYEFLNEPLHWCDVKFDNFGLSADYPKRFMIMDADMVFTESRMQKLLDSLNCRSDEDCHFLDCIATCDLNTHHCTNRINDNVEVFCQKLVLQLFGSFWTKSNRYLAACHEHYDNATIRLNELRTVLAWNLPDV